MTRCIAIGIALAALCACGGSQTETKTGESEGAEGDVTSAEAEGEARGDEGAGEGGSESELSDEERALMELRSRQLAGCEAMCGRLAECAIADAEAREPEELEGEDLEALAERQNEECRRQCEGSELSLRQIETIEDCVEAEEGCEAFLDCLDAVQPEAE